MKALILAAGYGTRLYPLTKKYPKALLPVGTRPLIDYIIDKLSGIKSISEVIVVTNDKFFSNFASWAKRSRLKSRGFR
ncbi:nucleotidyltransferase family protein, partial [bacterium]